MSRATAGKIDPRIPEREVMVTRRKSAQMKRQLRDKDRSMKHLTDLLKSPTKQPHTASKTVPVTKKQPSPKVKQSLLKSVEKIQNLPQKTFKLSKVLRKEILVQNEECHPNKRKRKLNVNKVVLKPKTTMKVVGEISGSVKRKYAIPLKVSDKPEPHQPTPISAASSKLSLQECEKLSMSEAIQIMDEQLTDEDLMEILTCPSPVWWEDPPDEDYIEDAIFTRSPPVSEKKDVTLEKPEPMEVDTDIVEKDADKIVPLPNLTAKSDKFLKKQSKLEKLLGNIKEKTIKKTSEKPASNEDVMVICSNYRANTDQIKVQEVAKSNKLEAKFSESDDELVFHNSSMNEDELLKDLENMDIPIAKDVIVIDDDDDNDFLEQPTSEEANLIQENKSEDNEATKEVGVPKNLPALQRCNVREEIASPKSLDSLSSKSSVTSSFSKDIDTISDTNVRYLLEDEDDNKNKIAAYVNDSNKCNNNESTESDKEAFDDSVTVYKIIEEINETSTDNNANNESNENATANEKDILSIVDAKLNEYYKNIANNESNEKPAPNEKDILGIVDAKLNDYYKNIANNESNEKATSNKKDIPGIVDSKLNDYYKNIANNESHEKSTPNGKDILSIADAKLNDYYKKCKKVYQQKRLKNERTDINKNEMTENERTDNYSTVSCDQCKPTFKKVSENENVKYCLKCSSIFDSKDCTYCLKKSNTTCVLCKIIFCCENYYKIHSMNCSEHVICKDELTDIVDNDNLNTDTKIRGLSSPVCL